MRRREFFTLLGCATAAWSRKAHAQQTEQMRRIGVLMGLDPDDAGAQTEAVALEHGLQERGWIEGRNLELKFGWSGAAPDLIQSSAKVLLRQANARLSSRAKIKCSRRSMHTTNT